MQTRILFQNVLLLLAAVCWLGRAVSADEADKDGASPPTHEVQAGDLTLTVPTAWKDKGSTEFRLAQFDVPQAEADKTKDEPTEFVVFYFRGGGGGVQDNVDRWIKQFQPEERTVKVTTGTCPQGDYVLADLRGTYKKPVGPPVFGRFKEVPDARVLAVILDVKGKGRYYLKMAGPEPTVAAAAAAFRTSFGAVADKEQEYKPGT